VLHASDRPLPPLRSFLNKALSDFNLALDLGFLTKTRKYTFFKPKFIFYATYLSEKIGYWRYITIYRHLKENPDKQLYPIFKKFENWCQDENRHGDFFSALLKSTPQFLNDWKAKLWSRFFCLSVSAREDPLSMAPEALGCRVDWETCFC
jgi:magnesium-protoporphyrin IX monomethyl ester (oxidative) cyclase